MKFNQIGFRFVVFISVFFCHFFFRLLFGALNELNKFSVSSRCRVISVLFTRLLFIKLYAVVAVFIVDDAAAAAAAIADAAAAAAAATTAVRRCIYYHHRA